MLDEILKYYKSNVSYNALIFKHEKFLYWLSNIYMYIFALSGVVFITVFIFFRQYLIPVISINILIICLGVVLIYRLNIKAKSILLSYHHIKSPEKLWRCSAIEDKRDKLFLAYLEMKKLKSKEKIQQLIYLFDKEAAKLKYQPFIIPSILLVLFIPAWSQLMIIMYKPVTSVEEAAVITFALLVGIYIFLNAISAFILLYKELIDPILNQKYYLIKEVLNILEKVLLRIPD